MAFGCRKRWQTVQSLLKPCFWNVELKWDGIRRSIARLWCMDAPLPELKWGGIRRSTTSSKWSVAIERCFCRFSVACSVGHKKMSLSATKISSALNRSNKVWVQGQQLVWRQSASSVQKLHCVNPDGAGVRDTFAARSRIWFVPWATEAQCNYFVQIPSARFLGVPALSSFPFTYNVGLLRAVLSSLDLIYSSWISDGSCPGTVWSLRAIGDVNMQSGSSQSNQSARRWLS
jgi:hypothetical protein